MPKKWTQAEILKEYQKEKQAFVNEMDADYPAYVKDCKAHDEEPVSKAEYRQMAATEYASYEEWLKINNGNFN